MCGLMTLPRDLATRVQHCHAAHSQGTARAWCAGALRLMDTANAPCCGSAYTTCRQPTRRAEHSYHGGDVHSASPGLARALA